jgi:hypothetical protein
VAGEDSLAGSSVRPGITADVQRMKKVRAQDDNLEQHPSQQDQRDGSDDPTDEDE